VRHRLRHHHRTLKEGWDCSFAYVFCSVSPIQSATDVEQLLGRVLRMPYAKRRAENALNRAYAHVSEASFGAAANALVDKLVHMGFDEEEAKEAVEPAQGHLDETGLFAPRERPKPTFTHTVGASQELVQAIGKHERKNVELRYTQEGRHEIYVSGFMDQALEDGIAQALPDAEREGFRKAAARYRLEIGAELSPAERGEDFVVPALMAEVQGELGFADTDLFMELHDWTLADYPARLDENAFSIRETARSFEIDIDGKRVIYQFANEADQLSLDVDVEGWTQQNLVLWLDRQLRQHEISQSDLLKWLSDCVRHLVGPRKLPMAALMRTKFILARKLKERIAAAYSAERNTVYQRYLFAPEAKVEVSFENGFAFRDGMYRDGRRHRGRWQPRAHFLGPANVPAFDGVEGGEEFQCAQFLDSLAPVRFWVRNVARHPESFWLPTATDKFYPDFVAQLNDGRLFVVEYKGALTAEGSDTDEKRAIGRLWESKSAGKGLFAVIEKEVGGRDMRRQMLEKIGTSSVSAG
jgi:type III restriction enzyme